MLLTFYMLFVLLDVLIVSMTRRRLINSKLFLNPKALGTWLQPGCATGACNRLSLCRNPLSEGALLQAVVCAMIIRRRSGTLLESSEEEQSQ